ncbi:MAG: hypothetical protein ACE5DK_07400 [Paracoccaceae bacterium]
MTLAIFMSPAQATLAFHGGETLNLDFGAFSIHGSYSKRACSAQANLKSARGKNVGFAIYWRPRKDIFLLVSHAGNKGSKGSRTVRFTFDDGKFVLFPMRGKGAQLQVPIGFGPRGLNFYDSLQKNRHVTIEFLALKDRVEVDLSRKGAVEAGLMKCRKWMHM